MSSTGIAAEFRQVWKTYPCGLWSRRSIQALRGVNLSIPRGSIYGLVGPNRAGKTTLVKLLLSIAFPTRGSVLRLGQPANDRTTLARMGYVHDSQAFPSYWSARTLLECYGALSGLRRDTLRNAVARRLDQVGLRDRAAEPIGAFSKGMLQRLALAQALLNEPELLVLDEPAEGMDLVARNLLHDLLRERQQQGSTAILVSHGLSDVQRVCDQLAVINYGEVAFAGKVEDLIHDGQHDGADLEEVLKPLYASAAP